MVDPSASEFPILIVDDDAVSQMSLGYLLRKLGYRDYDVVETFADAQAAVQMREFSVLLINPRVAEDHLNGIEVMSDPGSLLVANASRPIICLGEGSEASRLQLASVGRNVGRLDHPYSVEALSDSLERAQSLSKDLRQLPSEDCYRMLEQALDTIQVGVCVVSEDGRFVRVNRAYSRVFGYEEAELLGKPFTTILPRHLRTHAEELHARFMRGESKSASLDWQMVCKNGDVRETVVKSVRFEARDGQVFKITTITDVTDSRSREKDLERALQEREAAVRGAYTRSRTSLQTMAKLLRGTMDRTDGEAREAMRGAACRAHALSLLHDVFYHEEGMAVVSVNNYIRLLWDMVRSAYPEAAEQLQMTMELGDVELDMERATHLGLFINEALTNVVRHAFSGDFFGQITIRLAGNAKRIHVAVSDNGSGLSDTFSLEDAGSSGFQLIRESATRLGGEVFLEGVAGTRLSLTFPR